MVIGEGRGKVRTTDLCLGVSSCYVITKTQREFSKILRSFFKAQSLLISEIFIFFTKEYCSSMTFVFLFFTQGLGYTGRKAEQLLQEVLRTQNLCWCC